MNARPQLLAVLIFGVLATGGTCAPNDPSIPDPTVSCPTRAAPGSDDEAMVVGKSSGDTIAPFIENEALELHFGVQGGQHVFVSVLAHSTKKTAWRHEFTLRRASDFTEIGSATDLVDAICDAGWSQTANILLFVFDVTSEPLILEARSSVIQNGVPERTLSKTFNVKLNI